MYEYEISPTYKYFENSILIFSEFRNIFYKNISEILFQNIKSCRNLKCLEITAWFEISRHFVWGSDLKILHFVKLWANSINICSIFSKSSEFDENRRRGKKGKKMKIAENYFAKFVLVLNNQQTSWRKIAKLLRLERYRSVHIL